MGKSDGQEKQSLATVNPDLAKEWHKTKNLPLTPKDVAPNSNKKAWWTCKVNKDHVWEATIQSRNSGKGCGLCRGLVVLTGVNDLATLFPKIAKTWDDKANLPLDKTKVSPTSKVRVNWVCGLGHSYSLPIKARVKGADCQVCNNHQILSGFNDLKTLFPKIAKEFAVDLNDGIKSKSVGAGSGTKYWWRCARGHTWKTSVTNRTVLESTCPSCSRSRVEEGETDFGSLYPQVAMEWSTSLNAGVNPKLIASSSQAKYWWDCSKGHSWKATVSDRVRGQGCAVCSNRQVISGVNDLATTHPKIASQLSQTKNPSNIAAQIPAGTPRKFWWACELGHEWRAAVSMRALAGQGCPYCSGNLVLEGTNDLETMNPDLAQEWHSLKNSISPAEIKSGSGKVVWWLCRRGHEWKATVTSRTRGNGCPFCSNVRVLTGFNDLLTAFPDIASSWDYSKNSTVPGNIMPGSHSKYWWTCSKQHSWQASPNKRIQGRNCPTCAPSGFVPGKPGVLYFVRHRKWSSFKIGITNQEGKRLNNLYKNGWEPIQLFSFDIGAHAETVEAECLRWIRHELLLPPFLSNDQMPRTGGWTETFSSELISEKEVIAYIDKTIANLEFVASEYSKS